VFPEVECKQNREARELAELMVVYKDRVEGLPDRVAIDHDPADATSPSDFFNVFDKILSTTVLLCGGLRECRVCTPALLSLKLLEVIFVHAHAVELEREASAKFCNRELVAFARFISIRGVALERLHNQIHVLHIAFVEGEVHLDLFLREPGQGWQIICPGRVGHRGILTYYTSRMKSFYWILFLLLLAGNILVYRALIAPTVLKVSVLSVGKGDAVLVQTPSDKTLLIDTGPDASILRALGSALPFWQRRIDAVIITNSGHGSTGGLAEVSERYDIENLIRPDTTEERIFLGDGAYAEVLSSPKSAPILRVSYGSTTITISSSTPLGVYTSNGQVIK